MSEKKLYRSCKNRVLGGVCGGLGEYFDIDPVLIRLIVALLIFTGLSVIFYIVAWIVIPEDPACHREDNSNQTREKEEKVSSEIKKPAKVDSSSRGDDDGRLLVGAIVILIGVLFLLQNIFGMRAWDTFWPLILVGIGLYFIFKTRK